MALFMYEVSMPVKKRGPSTAMENLPGWALSSATSSVRFFAGTFAFATSTKAPLAIMDTGVKSLIGS